MSIARRMRRAAARANGKKTAAGFNESQMMQILAEGNRPDFTEFVGVRCPHNRAGSVMSFETYVDHIAAGCRIFRAADNYIDLMAQRLSLLTSSKGANDG